MIEELLLCGIADYIGEEISVANEQIELARSGIFYSKAGYHLWGS